MKNLLLAVSRVWLTIWLTVWLTASLPAAGGTLLVANKSAASVSLFDENAYALVATVAVGQGPHEIAVSPDGLSAVVSNYGTRGKPGSSLSLIDIGEAAVVKTLQLPPDCRPHGVQWVDEHTVAVTAEGIDSLLLVDTDDGEISAQIPVEQSVTHMLTLSPDATVAYAANIGSGSVSIISLAQRRKLQDIRAGEGTEGIALIGGSEVWVSNRQDGSVQVFDGQTFESLAVLPLGGFPIRVEPDDQRGRVYVTQAVGDSLAVYDAATRELLERVDFSGESSLRRSGGSMLSDLSNGSIPVGLLLSGNGDRIYVAHTQSDAISVIDAQSLELLRVLDAGDEPDGMAWSPLRRDLSRGTSAGGR